jgi:iron complex outermembrane receptor protein
VRPVTHIQSLRPFSRGYWAEGVLTSTGDGALSWLLGANYFRDLSEARPSLVANALSYYGIRSKAASVFAEASYKITDELSVTGGLRYNYDKKDAFFTPVSPAGVSTSGSKSFDSVTPRLVVKYQPDPDLNFYASYSEGFKSGGFAADSAAGATVARAVEPETVKAYEVGVKSDLIRNLRLNLATFLYNYNDLQVLAVITTPTSSVSLLSNAAKARIYGAEASVDWALTDALTLRGGLSLLHTEFTRFPAATVIEQRPLVNGLGVGNVTVNGVNLKGRELMRAPDHTFNVSLEHRADLLDGELTSTVSFFRSARYWADVNNRVAQPAYNILDATVAWRAPNNITLSVSGKNLTNAKYSTQIFINANGDQVTYDRPRQIIVGVAYDF